MFEEITAYLYLFLVSCTLTYVNISLTGIVFFLALSVYAVALWLTSFKYVFVNVRLMSARQSVVYLQLVVKGKVFSQASHAT